MDMSWLGWLPSKISDCLKQLPDLVINQLEEIRIRQERPLEIRYGGTTAFVSKSGLVSGANSIVEAYIPTYEDGQNIIQRISNYSLYAVEEELRRGYITVAGGHRIGIAGRTVLDHGSVKLIRDITSFNIRIAREMVGASDSLIRHLYDHTSGWVHNVLIISPPQCGKTTLLRDMARRLSYGVESNKGWKVGIIDERSELAASYKGVPQYDVGPRTDVLDSCPKVEGMMMMIRSMSPDVLIVDEIGRPEDSEAIFEALLSGVAVITSAHGRDVEHIARRPSIQRLMDEKVFDRYIVLSNRNGAGTVEVIYDKECRRLPAGEMVRSCSS